MIFGSLRKDLENKAVAVAFIMTWDEDVDGADAAPGRLAGFRRELYLSQPDAETSTVTSRYGTAVASSWNRAHPKLKARGAWEGHQGALPVIEGTLIRLTVDHLPHDRAPKPVWLWTSRPDADPAEADLCWQAFLRRFDLEHTFRFLKQALGWTRPKLRDPAAADRWTWLVIAACAQLRLARRLAADLRLPWQQPCRPGRLTPGRVRRGSAG